MPDVVQLFPDRQPAPHSSDRTFRGDHTGGGTPPGGDDVDARVAKLETHAEYMRRDLDEIRGDVKIIKNRLNYIAGAAAVIALILAWIANNRFEQVVELLAK